jgi:polysaccharide export outer membrane protein
MLRSSDLSGHCPFGRVCSFVRSAVAGAAILATATGATAAQEAAPVSPAPASSSSYAIGAGDRLKLFVWKEPELTQEIDVRVDGVITVPLIGDVHAAGLTTSDLSAAIQEKLARFVNSPSVTVGVTNALSAQFFILGRVARPGAYALDKPTSFLQALALAGGFADFAKSDRVLVFRVGQAQPVVLNYKKLESGTEAGENLPLRSGDTIVVP